MKPKPTFGMSNNRDMTLEQRIASVLGSNSPEPRTISNLIVEVEAGIADVDVIAARLQEVALDPIKSPDAAKAREAAEFARFVAKRLRNVLPGSSSVINKSLPKNAARGDRADFVAAVSDTSTRWLYGRSFGLKRHFF